MQVATTLKCKESKTGEQNEQVQKSRINTHTHTQKQCSNVQSTAKGQYQSTPIKQNAYRETLTKQGSRKY